MNESPTIVVENLGKVFQSPAGLREMLRGRLFGEPVEALAGVSFTVARGEIACLMGPNGAGKSTLVRILGGLLVPSSGRARVTDIDAGAGTAEFRRRVAFVVGDERSFHFRVSGRGNLHYFAALHGSPAAVGRRGPGSSSSGSGLAAAADRPYREYSRGMRQRLAIARGLLGDPEVLLLDEPTLGLDPLGARDLRAFLRDDIMRGAGRTAIVCSNDPGRGARDGRSGAVPRGGAAARVESAPDRIEAELGL